jgi:hypothetical protein
MAIGTRQELEYSSKVCDASSAVNRRLADWHRIIPRVVKNGMEPNREELVLAFNRWMQGGMLLDRDPKKFFDDFCRYNKLPVLSDFLSDKGGYQP